MTIDRRAFLARLGLLSLAGACARAGAGAAAPAASASRAGRRPRLLVFTKSSGFVHSVVKPAADGSPSLVDRTLTALAARDGFDVTCTRDGSVFTADGLRDYDAFLFFTSGVLTERGGNGSPGDGQPPFPAGGKQALLDAVASGKGFVGIHATTDSFHTPPDPADRSNRYVAHGPASDPFVRMLGGEFIAHGKQQQGTVRVADARFPGMERFVDGTRRMGEWYSLKDFSPDLHVLMVLDTAGMEGLEYQRGPFPVTWARRHDKGRVLYSALGHREEEWEDPAFLGLLSGSLRWAFGQVEADVRPNLATVAPRYAEIPPRKGA